MKVRVIGASNVDVIARSRQRVVAADSNIGTVEKAPGGVGRNLAFALRALGFEVSFLTALSDDEYGDIISYGLKEAGIKLCHGQFPSTEARTGVYCCIMDGDGSLVCAVNDMEINERITADLIEAERKEMEECDYVVFEANLPVDTIKAIASLDVRLVADCVSTLKAPKLSDVLENLYLLKANFPEACTLAELDDVLPDEEGLQTVMEALVAKGLRRAIISLGREGAFCYEVTGTGTRGFEVKVPPGLEVISTNGCGDVLLSGFLRALSEGYPIQDALYYGQAASAINAGSMEAVSPSLNFENTKKKVEEHYEHIS